MIVIEEDVRGMGSVCSVGLSSITFGPPRPCCEGGGGGGGGGGVFFFQADDGRRDTSVTGVQTCALPILVPTLFDISTPLLDIVG